jgi:CxxC-x17-CxxC domain-containing protein
MEKISRRGKKRAIEALNKHINFEREGSKGNSRKWATDVICCKCNKKFTLPFKPRRPDVYCDDCFKKKKL